MNDLITLMQFEAGELSEREVAEMIAEMVQEQGFEGLADTFSKVAKRYIHKGIMDYDGNLNYIKLKEEE